jgi:hypothetical protein
MTLYTVYRTQNTVNGKYYFGVHKTDNPHDGYLGSGTLLKRAIAKYGEQTFLKNVCFVFDNPEEAFAKEFELIETYRSDSLCYNLRQGGSGGFDWINREGLNGTASVTADDRKRAYATRKHKAELDPKYRERIERGFKLAAEAVKALPIEIKQASALRASRIWIGGKHRDVTLAILREIQKGKANSQFGTRWMMKDGITQKVKAENVSRFMSDGWAFGRISSLK